MMETNGKIEKIFATYIYHCVVDNPLELNKSIDKEISKIKFNKKKEWSNTHYLTTDFSLEDEPDIIKKHNLNLVDEEIKKHVKAYSSQVGSHYSFLPYTRTSWFSLFKKGNYAHIHRHGFSDISGVYYYRTNGSDGEYFKFVDKSTILSGSSKKLSTIKFGYISRQVVFRMVLNRILL